jgi:hypothetical protein
MNILFSKTSSPFVDEHLKRKPSLVLKKLARSLRHVLPSDQGIFKLQARLALPLASPYFGITLLNYPT